MCNDNTMQLHTDMFLFYVSVGLIFNGGPKEPSPTPRSSIEENLYSSCQIYDVYHNPPLPPSDRYWPLEVFIYTGATH